MKANEAPEKIYLKPLLMENGESIIRRCTFERQRDSQIEYIRADALDDLITKSAVWFANRYQANGSYLCATDVEDYRKEIKEYIRADIVDSLINKSAVWFADKYQANGSYLCATDVEDYRKEIKEYIKQKWL